MIRLRACESDADYELWLDVRRAVHPEDRTSTLAELHGYIKPGDLHLLAYLDGELAASGLCNRSDIAGNAFLGRFGEACLKRTVILPTPVDTSKYTVGNSEPSRLTIGWVGLSDGFVYLRQASPIYAKVENSHGLLRNALQQTISSSTTHQQMATSGPDTTRTTTPSRRRRQQQLGSTFVYCWVMDHFPRGFRKGASFF